MPFELFYLPSYERCLEQLGFNERQISGVIAEALFHYFQSNNPLTGAPYIYETEKRSYRLVFKKLRANIWEAYVEGKIRLLTRQEGARHYLVFAGNHDQVQKFLKKN